MYNEEHRLHFIIYLRIEFQENFLPTLSEGGGEDSDGGSGNSGGELGGSNTVSGHLGLVVELSPFHGFIFLGVEDDVGTIEAEVV